MKTRVKILFYTLTILLCGIGITLASSFDEIAESSAKAYLDKADMLLAAGKYNEALTQYTDAIGKHAAAK